ncbi:helix-turn-helix domain-containing protein [Bacteroidota bacterium]
MKNLTFNDIPEAMTQLFYKVENIERLLLEKSKESQSETNDILTVELCAKFLHLAKPTIYGLISRRELPVLKRGKRCYFKKVDILEYLEAGRQKTYAEISREADEYLVRRKK